MTTGREQCWVCERPYRRILVHRRQRNHNIAQRRREEGALRLVLGTLYDDGAEREERRRAEGRRGGRGRGGLHGLVKTCAKTVACFGIYTQCHSCIRSRPGISNPGTLLAMCRVILTALLAVGLFAICVLTALWMQPGALSKLGATQSQADGESETIALHPNAIARMRAQMARRVAPWQPQAAQFVQERVAMVCAHQSSIIYLSVCAVSECAHCEYAASSLSVSKCRSLKNAIALISKLRSQMYVHHDATPLICLCQHYNVAKPKKPLVLSFQGCEECGQMTILEVLGQSLWDAKHQVALLSAWLLPAVYTHCDLWSEVMVIDSV